MRIRITAACLTAFCAAISLATAQDVTLGSPDGRVQFRLSLANNGQLQYAVAFREKAVIAVSPLGLIVDGVKLGEGAQIGKIDRYTVNETYPWYGAHAMAKDRCNGMKIAMIHVPSHSAYTLEVRAYDEGIAFRQVVPGSGRRIPDEATLFRLPAGSTVWYHDTEGHYEGVHVRKSIASVPAGDWAAPPVTFRLAENAGYASITEGALVQSFPYGKALEHGKVRPEDRGTTERVASQVSKGPGWDPEGARVEPTHGRKHRIGGSPALGDRLLAIGVRIGGYRPGQERICDDVGDGNIFEKSAIYRLQRQAAAIVKDASTIGVFELTFTF